MKRTRDAERPTRSQSKPQKGIRGALDELGLTDAVSGKRPVRKGPITVKALREQRRKS